MPWGVAAAAIGAAGSIYSANKASKGQGKAGDAAAAAQLEMYNQTREDNTPALQARNAALEQTQNLASKYGGGMPTAEQVMATPGYQFGLTQGRNALEQGAAARGGLYSGQAGKDLVQYGNDYGTGKYDAAFNRLQTSQTNDFNRWASIGGLGQTGANQLASAGQNYANAVGGIGMANANAQGAATIAQGNALQTGLNQGVSWWNNRQSPNGTMANTGYNVGYGGNSAGGSPDGYWADGGPVREPVVGTRTPLPQGGGGGLSPEAILQALALREQMMQMQPLPGYGINPRAVQANRLQRVGLMNGGPVDGRTLSDAVGGNDWNKLPPKVRQLYEAWAGGPKDDAIPAWLSNGEHVVDTASVTAIGGGSNPAGQQKLNRLRMSMRGGM